MIFYNKNAITKILTEILTNYIQRFFLIILTNLWNNEIIDNHLKNHTKKLFWLLYIINMNIQINLYCTSLFKKMNFINFICFNISKEFVVKKKRLEILQISIFDFHFWKDLKESAGISIARYPFVGRSFVTYLDGIQVEIKK